MVDFGRRKLVMGIASAISLAGCVSPIEIANYSEMLNNIWLAEFQKSAREQHFRIIEMDSAIAYKSAKDALLELGMPIVAENPVEGIILSSANAPTPLSSDEWRQVVKMENPRVRKISNGTMYLDEDPKGFFIDVEVEVKRIQKNLTRVRLNYRLRNPSYASMGFQLPKFAPPQAALLGSLRYWKVLDEAILKRTGLKGKSRKLKPDELIA